MCSSTFEPLQFVENVEKVVGTFQREAIEPPNACITVHTQCPLSLQDSSLFNLGFLIVDVPNILSQNKSDGCVNPKLVDGFK